VLEQVDGLSRSRCDQGKGRAEVGQAAFRIAEGAFAELCEVAPQGERVAALAVEQGLEGPGAIGVPAELVLQPGELLSDAHVVRGHVAGVHQGMGGASGLVHGREESGPLHMHVAFASGVDLPFRLALECVEQRIPTPCHAVNRCDPCQNTRVGGTLLAQPRQPGQGGICGELLRGEGSGVLDGGDARVPGRVREGRLQHLEQLARPLFGLEQCGELFAQWPRVHRQRDGALECGHGRVDLSVLAGQDARAPGFQLGALGIVARSCEAHVDEVEGGLTLAQRVGELDGAFEALAMAGLELEHAPGVVQGVGDASVCRVGQQLCELESNRDLLGAGEMRELRLEKLGQRHLVSVLPVKLPQRGLEGAIVGPVRECLSVGVGGIASFGSFEERVTQSNEPVGAFGGIRGSACGIATELDEVEVVARPGITAGQGQGDRGAGPGLAQGDLQRRDRGLEISLLGIVNLGDLHAQRGALDLGVAVVLVGGSQGGEARLEYGEDLLGALLLAVTRHQVARGGAVRGVQLEDPGVVLGGPDGVFRGDTPLGEPGVQGELPAGFRICGELCPRRGQPVVPALLLLVAVGEAPPDVASTGIDFGDAFEVSEFAIGVREPHGTDLGEPVPECLLVVRAGSGCAGLQVFAKTRPLVGAFEVSLVTQGGLVADLHTRSSPAQLVIDLGGFGVA
jgi:hypothetical protein